MASPERATDPPFDSDTEKNANGSSDVAYEVVENVANIHEFSENEGYVVEGTNSANANLKRASDGQTILVPQPSDDPNDPLNWSWWVKHSILLIIGVAAFLPDYGSAVGAITLIPQATQWNITEDTVNHSQDGNIFGVGVGGLVVVVLGAYFGRLPVLFVFLTGALATAAWCAAAKSFNSFMGARILNGFFSTIGQTGGLMWIYDLFYFHERARKVNIWAASVIVSPYIGPALTAFIVTTQKWPVGFWVYTALCGLAFVLCIVFGKETYYDRRIPIQQQPKMGSRVSQMFGISQWRGRHQRNTFKQALMRPVKLIIKPTMFMSFFYYMCTFSSTVGINTTLAIFLGPLYNFGTLQIGYFYFTPIVAAILGEIVGHWLHDAIANSYIKRHNGHFEPEVRLRAILVAEPFMICGLIGLGFALQNGYHYMVSSVLWGMYVFGIMIATVALNAYNLDAYPEASGESAAWINFARDVGGFIVSYFQVEWAAKEGAAQSFGIQSCIIFAAFLCVVALIFYGKTLRIKSGPLNFATS